MSYKNIKNCYNYNTLYNYFTLNKHKMNTKQLFKFLFDITNLTKEEIETLIIVKRKRLNNLINEKASLRLVIFDKIQEYKKEKLIKIKNSRK